MKVTLVAMPWQTLEMPAMPLGVLGSHLQHVRPHVEVQHVYGTTAWAHFVNVESRGQITLEHYMQIANSGVYDGIGEWVFTSALYPNQEWPLERFATFCNGYVVDNYPNLLEMWRLAPSFIDEMATVILDGEPSLVGLSSTFSQNIASLALARVLKERRPELPIIMGGANCDGVMGPALLRNFPVLDAVCVGEGEETLVELVDALSTTNMETKGLEDIAGLCWRSPAGAVAVNPARPARFKLNTAPAPDFDAFFTDLHDRGMSRRLRKRIPYEASRGCWWGEKKHCTFCGLNGTGMDYRSRDGAQVFADILELSRKYRLLDIIFVDNILDLQYFKTLIPRFAESDLDFRLFFEVKSNIKEQQVAELARAHVAAVQPGIESLSTDILKVMRKGVDAAQNVIFLRSAEENSVTSSWNMLYGFPGETESQYERVIQQVPNLCHLQAPTHTRISLQRFSPNFDDLSLGFQIRSPAPMYKYLYDLPRGEMADLAFFHQSESQGISGAVESRLIAALDAWETAYVSSSLGMYDYGDCLVIHDRRELRPHADYEFSTPWHCDLIRAARSGRSLERLCSDLLSNDHAVDVESVSRFVAHLVEIGVLFCDERDDGSSARYVALPLVQTPAAQTPVLALDGARS